MLWFPSSDIPARASGLAVCLSPASGERWLPGAPRGSASKPLVDFPQNLRPEGGRPRNPAHPLALPPTGRPNRATAELGASPTHPVERRRTPSPPRRGGRIGPRPALCRGAVSHRRNAQGLRRLCPDSQSHEVRWRGDRAHLVGRDQTHAQGTRLRNGRTALLPCGQFHSRRTNMDTHPPWPSYCKSHRSATAAA